MFQDFVSKSQIDGKKQKRKEHFQDKLKKAQDEYAAVKNKRELEESRGDAKWILPSLESRISDESKLKKRDKHKKTKHKKKKHKHKKSKHASNSSAEESDEWEEAQQEDDTSTETKTEAEKSKRDYQATSSKAEPVQRDDWMMASSLLDLATSSTSSREHKTKKLQADKREKEEKERLAIQQSRELNPFLNEKGRGASDESKIKTKAEVTSYVPVGDGGRSWIHKSYERVKQQSIDEGIPLDDLIAKRWGSKEKLNALLKAADRSARPSSSRSSGGWRKSETRTSGWKRQSSSVKETDDDVLKKDITSTKDPPSKNSEPPKVSESTKSRNNSSSDENSSNSSAEETEDARVKEEIIMEPLNEKEKNEINAKILRAELMGDDEKGTSQDVDVKNQDAAAELKKRLETGKRTVRKVVAVQKPKVKKVKNDSADSSSSEEEGEEVVLTRADKHGNLYPVKLENQTSELDMKRKRKKKKIMSTHDDDGKRVRYFEDDDQMDLKSMVEQERLTSTADQQAQLARLAGKHLGKAQGDDYTLDDMFVAASATKGMKLQEEKRIKKNATQEHRRRELQASSCRFCFDNPRITKHLIIAIGIKTYMVLPLNASLTEGHCIITPMNHVSSQTYLDEDVIQEVKIFKKGLTRMFSDKGEDAIFLETCKNLNRQPHCIIECVPVPKEIADMAPIYFKKAIEEVGSEWRENKRIVDIKANDGVAKVIPKGLPYFSVEFGVDGGFAHVIEDEETFPFYFGKEIIGGMLDLEPRMWRKPTKESFEQHKRKVLKFADCWKPYDWTYRLKEDS